MSASWYAWYTSAWEVTRNVLQPPDFGCTFGASQCEAGGRRMPPRRPTYEVDLQRLEAALLAARQGEADERVGRWPPASRLPPVAGLRSPDNTRIDDRRSPRSREPSHVRLPPMRERTNHRGRVLRVLGVCALGASIAYFVPSYFGAGNDLLTTIRGLKLSMVETQTAAPRETIGIATASRSPAASRAASPAPSSASLVFSPPAAPASHAPAPTLGREDIAMLLEKGDQFISVGDV